MRLKWLSLSAVMMTSLFVLSACGGGTGSVPSSDAYAGSPVHPAALGPLATTTERVAISSCQTCFTYQLGPAAENYTSAGLQPRRTITNGIAAPWVGLLFDPTGDLYVANCTTCLTGQSGVNNVVKIKPTKRAPSLAITNGITYPYDLALDASGTLYVSNLGCYSPSNPCHVSEYAKTYTGGPATQTISVQYPLGLAIDKEQNLYVANCNVCASGTTGSDQILVYAPGATTPTRTITTGVNEPVALAIDSSDDLYVSNCMNCGLGAAAYLNGSDSITEYGAGGSTPIKTIAFTAVDIPFSIAVDPSADLFVANLAVNTVTEYPPGDINPSRIISQGISSPASIAVDHNGAVYVSNSGNNTATKYNAKYRHGAPSATASIQYPSSIAVQP